MALKLPVASMSPLPFQSLSRTLVRVRDLTEPSLCAQVVLSL